LSNPIVNNVRVNSGTESKSVSVRDVAFSFLEIILYCYFDNFNYAIITLIDKLYSPRMVATI